MLIMATTDSKITAAQFCDFHGVDAFNRFVVLKKFSGTAKTYEEWFNSLKNEIDLGDKKDFGKPAPAPEAANNTTDKK